MTLLDNLKIFCPLTPDPPDENMKKISDALELAIGLHIKATFVPVGFGQTFISAAPQNPFILTLGQYLEATISPFISTAATTQATIGQLPAWAAVVPGILALAPISPVFMPGIFGVQFHSAVIVTIAASLPPPPINLEDSSDSSTGGPGSEEVLRIDT